MNMEAPLTLEVRDHEAYQAAKTASHQDLLVYAAKASGLSPLQIQRDYNTVAALRGRLTFPEYVRLGVFRPDRFTAEERNCLISNELHWPIAHKCNPQGWAAAAEDKALADVIMRSGGVAVPDTLAVIDRSNRSYPGQRKIATEEALRALLAEANGDRLFCKIVHGMVSFGAVRIEGHDATHIQCSGQEPVTYRAFLEEVVGDSAYMVQRELINHPEIAKFAPALATIRMVNLLDDTGLHVPFAAMKLPQGGNIADAFWRSGNLACDIDVATGVIQKISVRGLELDYMEDHPSVPGLMGLQLPYWSELKALNEVAASLYGPIRYQSTDIAITAEGPVVVELNYGGGFDLPQYASGKGMLTPQVLDYFARHGIDLDALGAAAKTKKKGLFGFGR